MAAGAKTAQQLKDEGRLMMKAPSGGLISTPSVVVDRGGGGGGGSSSNDPATIKLIRNALIEFVGDLGAAMIPGTSRVEIITFLQRSAQSQSLDDFIIDSESHILVFGKEIIATTKEEDDEHRQDTKQAEFFVQTDISQKALASYSIALLKRHSISLIDELDDLKSASVIQLGSKLQVINVGFADSEESFYELIQNILEFSFEPVLQHSLQPPSKTEGAAAGGAPITQPSTSGGVLVGGGVVEMEESKSVVSVRRKLRELLTSIQEVQQSLRIPEVVLVANPIIINAVAKARALGREPDMDKDIKEVSITDPDFLNTMQTEVNKWLKDISRVVKFDKDPSQGAFVEEINFQSSLEQSVSNIQTQLQSPEVLLQLNVLKRSKRCMYWEDTIGVKQKAEELVSINGFLRDFPINELNSANSLDQIRIALQKMFNPFRKLRLTSHYPLTRAATMVEVLSRDLLTQMLKVLSTQKILERAIEEFQYLYSNCKEIFKTWDEEYRKFRDLYREVAKKRNLSAAMGLTKKFEHAKLRDRLDEIRATRYEAYRFREVVTQVLEADSPIAREVINIDRMFVTSCDCLDLSPAGTEAWNAAKLERESRLTSVETQITQKVSNALKSATSGTEMFAIFSAYNPLFIRPKIKAAMNEYQADLINQVKNDFAILQQQFASSQAGGGIGTVARDIPNAVAEIIWARLLEDRIQLTLNRVEDVLGRQWTQHVDGQRLKCDGEAILKKLNTPNLITKWLDRAKLFNKFNAGVRLLAIARVGGAHGFEIVANMDPNFANLWKEVRFMNAYVTRIPFVVKNAADESRQIYPSYIAVTEMLRMAKLIFSKLEGDPRFQPIADLLTNERREIQTVMQEGFKWAWNADRLDSYQSRLSSSIQALDWRTEELSKSLGHVESLMRKLKSLPVQSEPQEYQSIVSEIRSKIEELAASSFHNLPAYVSTLEAGVSAILKDNLIGIIDIWIREFSKWPLAGKSVVTQELFLNLDISQQRIITVPSLRYARQYWTSEFHGAIAKICSLQRISSGIGRSTGSGGGGQTARYHATQSVAATGLATTRGTETSSSAKPNVIPEEETFSYILKQVPIEKLLAGYEAIDHWIGLAVKFYDTWKSYGELWRVDISALGTEIKNAQNSQLWHDLLLLLKQERAECLRGQECRYFGPVAIDFSGLQPKVAGKYDQRIRELLSIFAGQVNQVASGMLEELQSSRQALESQGDTSKLKFLSVDPSGLNVASEEAKEMIEKMTEFVLNTQKAKEKQADLISKVAGLAESEQNLKEFRYTFPADWIWAERVQGEWETFRQILKHQTTLFERYRPQLKGFIQSIDSRMQALADQTAAEWATTKPMDGRTDPITALNTLNDIDNKISILTSQYEQLNEAKMALGIPVQKSTTAAVDPRVIAEEVSGLREVWGVLSELHNGIQNLKTIPWDDVHPKRVREGMESLLEKLKSVPAKHRRYEAFDQLNADLRKYLTYNQLINELKSEVLKDKHWKTLLEIMQLPAASQHDLTLGDILDVDPKQFETGIREVLGQAQGENGLAEFLRSIRETWNAQEFELVPYKNKCKLIKGFDDLFNILDEQLNLLQSMRLSPYYSPFEEEASSWDDKLNKLRNILDVWLEAQRKWVYLEGVFAGSADIQNLLPNEFTKFKSIDADFINLMKKTSTRPKVIDCLTQEALNKQLSRFTDTLAKIQKALSDYLEKQRARFPRFYFVGDEDLLEMIGNSKDSFIVQRHLNKMFGGITQFITDPQDSHRITAIGSLENEIVELSQPIDIAKASSLNAWLKSVEVQMVNTLGLSLSSAVESAPSDWKETEKFREWVAKYPTQIMLLAMQIKWSESVEGALNEREKKNRKRGLKDILKNREALLGMLSEEVFSAPDKLLRTKYIQLITEIVHQRDVIQVLYKANQISGPQDFTWLQYMRFYYSPNVEDPLKRLTIKVANASFYYGFEYLGACEKLVQTDLTDMCYLTLTQALHLRLGGNPFGPAGTGKTETVKFLGAQLGRLVLVFCCDDQFDFHAMGRIFVGLCQVGAWGCFDEFNRLEERMLSAVSEQILTIQVGLREHRQDVVLLNQKVTLSENIGIFLTMNPGYAGRSNLPDSLKQLCREFAMITPDKVRIAEVLLFSQGFETANRLAPKIVSLFDLFLQQLSQQPHYDFGLRSLKAVLVAAGTIKRKNMTEAQKNKQTKGGYTESELINMEQDIVIRSICDTLVPKLVPRDIPRIQSLLIGVFPGASVMPVTEAILEQELFRLSQFEKLEPDPDWIQKMLQLYQIQNLHHGVMLVGPVGTGKSSAWRTLLAAMEVLDGVKGQFHIIEPKAVSKEQLFGKLDPTTLEWTDGVFTATLRKIMNSSEASRAKYRHWIVFDGDVDPEWAENLNSVLDDNKLLTLPNGERIRLGPNVRILFEVDTLKSATLATVSRCGMVWFSSDVVELSSMFSHFLANLSSQPTGDSTAAIFGSKGGAAGTAVQPALQMPSRGGSTFGPNASQDLDAPSPTPEDQGSQTFFGMTSSERLKSRVMVGGAAAAASGRNLLSVPGGGGLVPPGTAAARLGGSSSSSSSSRNAAKEEEESLRMTAVMALHPFFFGTDFDPELSNSNHVNENGGGTALGRGGSSSNGEKVSLVERCLQRASLMSHVMTFTNIRVTEALFALLRRALINMTNSQQDKLSEDQTNKSFSKEIVSKYFSRFLLIAIVWSFAGSMPLAERVEFAQFVAYLASQAGIAMPKDMEIVVPNNWPKESSQKTAGGSNSGAAAAMIDRLSLVEFNVDMATADWVLWKDSVPTIDVDPKQVEDAQFVIETVDTIRHRDVIGMFLQERRPFILCGPPGSGKTMTLLSSLKSLQSEFEIASLNFSSGSTPELLLKTFTHYCEYVKTAQGTILRPVSPGRWLIVFCDEINLPSPDKYDTQRVIMFMRQITEHGFFWRLNPQSQIWDRVRIERIQFAGACNPPTDAGRHPMSNRFLRNAPVLFVDFPGSESLRQIYGTFTRAMLSRHVNLAPHADAITNIMVEFYISSQLKFTSDLQPHYIYSPRELTRWKVALLEGLKDTAPPVSEFARRGGTRGTTAGAYGNRVPFETFQTTKSALSLGASLGDAEEATTPLLSRRGEMGLTEFVRMLMHEAHRIFRDRLVEEAHRHWTNQTLEEVVTKYLPSLSADTDLRQPILFSNLLTQNYSEVSFEDLRDLVAGKMQLFYEEEVNVKLVLFDQCLDHILRIDRVLRQPLGHLLLVGASGAGKTVLSRFVAWLNGLTVFQIKAGRNYDTLAFEADLRTVMKKAGVKQEKICFIFDESNVLGPAFLERMNALLAAGEVPGLFDGDELSQLMSECKAAFGQDSHLVTMDDGEIFARFTKQVQKNLHIVFTMNPANPDFYDRQATSPALFNRCVIDWFGDWPEEALLHVAREFTESIELGPNAFDASMSSSSEEERRDVLSRVIVEIHEEVAELNRWLQRGGRRYNYVTPRDYLDFLRHLCGLMAEKREEVRETARHLTGGLTKLQETEAQVAELQASLAVKEKELTEKSAQSEEKMHAMVTQKTEAEETKRQAEILARNLDEQESKITERKVIVEQQLSEVEPLLDQAKQSVSSIPKKALEELRNFSSPPQLVKFTVEAVCVLLNNLGAREVTWDECKKMMRQDFIQRILAFNPAGINLASAAHCRKKFLSSPEWNYERINKASQAAGPLSLWVSSSVAYAEIILRVEPLRKEIAGLEQALKTNQEKLIQTQKLIAELEAKLAQLQSEYGQLIADVQMIRKEMDEVRKKVDSSKILLSNLASEQTRWAESREASVKALTTVVGDNILSAAFCTYLGFFEHAERRRLMDSWRETVNDCGLNFQSNLSMIEFLSKASERYKWLANGLQSDDLSLENTVILKRYLRYPLIVDPTGQAVDFVCSLMSEERIVRTSFSDPGFLKSLESALRFGTALLVQDVETVDPIINSVLNQETHKAGGRVLIAVGDSEIDFSPKFQLILATRDPSMQFCPATASRVTFINFTVTPSSLQDQCLNMVLQSERPDVEKRRRDVLKLQGEFKVKIRELEDKLLYSLSNIQGNILDDEKVVASLEFLKAEAAKIAAEAKSADEIMAEVNQTTSSYNSISDAAARLFTLLKHLEGLHFLYQFDLSYFERIFKENLKAAAKNEAAVSSSTDSRVSLLADGLFKRLFDRTCLSLLPEDEAVVALQFAKIKFETRFKFGLQSLEFDLLLARLSGKLFKGRRDSAMNDDTRSSSNLGAAAPLINGPAAAGVVVSVSPNILGVGKLTSTQWKGLRDIANLPCFAQLIPDMGKNQQFWLDYLERDIMPETKDLSHLKMAENANDEFESSPAFAKLSEEDKSVAIELATKIMVLIRSALLIKTLRADRVPAALGLIVNLIMGNEFLGAKEKSLSSQQQLGTLVVDHVTAHTPVLLVSAPGFDPSAKIVALARDTNKSLSSIALGSEEGYLMAERAIQMASHQGGWVLLKNVHLASVKWLAQLDKSLLALRHHERFRLFLTMEFKKDRIPMNLLRASQKLIFEAPPGIKPSIERTYNALILPYCERTDNSKKTVPANSSVRNHLQFLIAFIHAITLERRRFVPIGWTKSFDFSDADLLCAMEVVDQWLLETREGDTATVPWQAFKKLLSDVIYGGRIDNRIDTLILHTWVDHIVREAALSEGFQLTPSLDESQVEGYKPSLSANLLAPSQSRNRQTYLNWITNMPAVENPVWLGLSSQAETLLAAELGAQILAKWGTLDARTAEDLRGSLPVFSFASPKVSPQLTRSISRVGTKRVESTTGPTLQASTTQMLARSGSVLAGGRVKEIYSQLEIMLATLPGGLKPLQTNKPQDSLFVFYEREWHLMSSLLKTISDDLLSLREATLGQIKFSNRTREIATKMVASEVPNVWLMDTYPSARECKTLAEWILDLCKRTEHLAIITEAYNGGLILSPSQTLDESHDIRKSTLNELALLIEDNASVKSFNPKFCWAGGLANLQAFLSATQQAVAQTHHWPLDDLKPRIIFDDTNVDDSSFILVGLHIQGAVWDKTKKVLQLSDREATKLPPSRLVWERIADLKTTTSAAANGSPSSVESDAQKDGKQLIYDMPLFLTKRRTNLIAQIPYELPPKSPALEIWRLRAVALISWYSA